MFYCVITQIQSTSYNNGCFVCPVLYVDVTLMEYFPGACLTHENFYFWNNSRRLRCDLYSNKHVSLKSEKSMSQLKNSGLAN